MNGIIIFCEYVFLVSIEGDKHGEVVRFFVEFMRITCDCSPHIEYNQICSRKLNSLWITLTVPVQYLVSRAAQSWCSSEI